MNTGMLWFDNDKRRPLATKIACAAAYYKEKYGQAPTLCFVHPTMLAKTSPEVQNRAIAICPDPQTRPHHLWIGVHKLETQVPRPDLEADHE